MIGRCKLFVPLVLLLMAISLCAQTSQLRVPTISAGTARLQNGSIVNIGQPLIGTFGSAQAGVIGHAGIVTILRRATGPATLPEFRSIALNNGGGIRLSFEADPGWTYGVEASTNLIDWSRVWITNSANGLIIFEDTSGFTHRFYRVTLY